LISWEGVETGLKTLLGGILEFEALIPQALASAATGEQPTKAIVTHQRCRRGDKVFAAPKTAAVDAGSRAIADPSQIR